MTLGITFHRNHNKCAMTTIVIRINYRPYIRAGSNSMQTKINSQSWLLNFRFPINNPQIYGFAPQFNPLSTGYNQNRGTPARFHPTLPDWNTRTETPVIGSLDGGAPQIPNPLSP